MKRLFFAVVALAMLATSCAKEDAPETTAKTETVTFSVKAPEMKTRAVFNAGTGELANKLYYAFYDENGDIIDALSVEGKNGIGYTDDDKKVWAISKTLVAGRTYTAIFWAQNDDSNFTPSFGTKLTEAKVEKIYGVSNVIEGNNEKIDAFWACVKEMEKKTGEEIQLKRPFAQLNIGVPQSDIDAAAAAGVTVNTVQVQVPNLYNTFNLADGTVGGDEVFVEFTWATKGEGEYVCGETTYTIYSTNYLLVGGVTEAQKQILNINFRMSETNGNDPVYRGLTAIPLQANYRTFVLGNVITGDDATFEWIVQVAPGFEDADEDGNPDDKNVDKDGAAL